MLQIFYLMACTGGFALMIADLGFDLPLLQIYLSTKDSDSSLVLSAAKDSFLYYSKILDCKAMSVTVLLLVTIVNIATTYNVMYRVRPVVKYIDRLVLFIWMIGFSTYVYMAVYHYNRIKFASDLDDNGEVFESLLTISILRIPLLVVSASMMILGCLTHSKLQSDKTKVA